MGDPAGVGPLIAASAWRNRTPDQRPFYLIAPKQVAMQALAATGVKGMAERAQIHPVRTPADVANAWASPDRFPLFDIDGPAPAAGKPDPASAPAIIRSIELAVQHVRAGAAAAVITNPISKTLLYKAGFWHPGHTEFLAELAADGGTPPLPVMMLVGGGLRVALVTIHQSLASVPGALSKDAIVTTARIVEAALKREFGFARPRIGLCGLNPHAGEDGALGAEERTIINPAAAQLRGEGVDISDARPGDTIFHEALGGRFDAVIAMYHDQGLIPVKTLDMWGGVNVTLGLPFIRTSPDHGTAYDAAEKGEARPESLIAAMTLASRMADARAKAGKA